MQINTQPSFTGKFSAKTLAKFQQNLAPADYKQVKKFKAGNKFTKFDIITIQNEPQRLSNGVVIMPKETFAEFSNAQSSNNIKARIKLADGELPFNMETFKLFTKELVKKGEQLLGMIK